MIELLVVIAIIAVLAGLLLPVVSKVTTNAQKVQAKAFEQQVVSAVKNFQTDYGVYPAPDGATAGQDYACGGTGAGTPTIAGLMDILRADNYGDEATYNTRAVVYLEVPAAKSTTAPAGGISQVAGANYGAPYDPWGSVYCVAIDGNYDNALVNPYSLNAGFNPIGTGVIVWSYGPDKASTSAGTGGYANSSTTNPPASGGNDKNLGTSLDDVISWQ